MRSAAGSPLRGVLRLPDYRTDVTHTSQQVRGRVRPVVGPDQLPVKVVVLALPVVAEAGLGVLVESAAGCGEEKKRKETMKGHEKETGKRKCRTGLPEERSEKQRLSAFKVNLKTERGDIWDSAH